MRWQGKPQSDNVEVATKEARSYGEVEILRNLKSGAISSINPIDLNNRCQGALTRVFIPVAAATEFIKSIFSPDVPGFTPAKEDSDCKPKVREFQKEAEANGLSVSPSDVKTPLNSTMSFIAVPPPKR